MIVAAVFLFDPDWFHGSARLHWPEPTFRNFVAIALILIVASASSHPHYGGDKPGGRASRPMTLRRGV